MTVRYAVAFSIALPFVTQAQNPIIQGILDDVRIDSMMQWVGELSGEVATPIDGTSQVITSRHKNNAGNALSQTYLEQKLAQFGYTPVIQSFSTTGKNILVTKPGDGSTDEVVIICAHYDAMPGGILAAPAADDDGSGTCAVLEAARILADVDFVHPIIFALWDEEEQGKIGSLFYAGAMAANDALIRGVVNMDAIAYDGNGDTKARIHTRPVANSFEISDTVFAVREDYNIDLDLILTNPGATYSDHASFWTEGYGAVLVIEEFSADGNPHYHTPDDRIQYFDVPYYEKLAKLSIATVATLAIPVESGLVVGEEPVAGNALYAFPNPTADDASLWIEQRSMKRARIVLLDALGREVSVLHDGLLAAGKHGFTLPLAEQAPGGYVVHATVDGAPSQSVRVVRLPW
ncbi:MAG: M20/M25/M40 family metallo-hydrolase [Flavobacteriales bacterium]|nr:M20/M25/M40 family metallo-hydrolase [Flavobacteriales bacterium]